MIFYVALDEDGRKHLLGTQADARAINKDFEQIDIPTDKAGLQSFVQALFNKAETQLFTTFEGLGDTEPAPQSEPAPAPISYADRSVEIDEVFMNLPLPHQLTLAAIAMENARSLIPN